MTESELTDAVIRWVREHAQLTDGQDVTITPNTDLFASGLLDSYGFIDLILYIESLDGFKIDLAAVDPRDVAIVRGLCRIAMESLTTAASLSTVPANSHTGSSATTRPVVVVPS